VTQPLRICLDTRLVEKTAGGLKQVAIGLASGFSKLTDGDEEYLFLVYRDDSGWLQPYVEWPAKVLRSETSTFRTRLRRRLAALPLARKSAGVFGPVLRRRGVALPKSDGTAEQAGADIVHFTTPNGFETVLPSIYHPHDLQHLHMPQFIDPVTCLVREARYRALCARARTVAVVSSWVKHDLIEHYGLPAEKIVVVPFAPPLLSYPTPSDNDLRTVRRKLGLPEAFVFYPAQTWPHKNHLGLLQALAILRDRYGMKVPFVLSGHRNEFFPAIEKKIHELGLAAQGRFVGFVSPTELQCLYRLCRCTVIPSKFEAASFPLWEAFLARAPAACSRVTSLPAQAGDAALLFDPDSPEQIADCIHLLWTDAKLREILAKRGAVNVARFSWEQTARIFRAHYRRIAGRILSEEDLALVAAEPML